MKYKLLILLCFSQILCVSVMAQNNLRIIDIFDKYGKKEGSILLQLSTDILSPKTDITLYKSLMIDYTPVIESEIISAVKTDIEKKIIISEVKKNGRIESGSYYLGNNNSETNEFILYKKKENKITLVYMKGEFPSSRLEKQLEKLKDLFIYVNNKRLKLQ